MRLSEVGFTLIELVIVIAIIAILAAVSIPKFINLSNDAQLSVTTAVAGALSAANFSNYASRKLNGTLGVPINNCTAVANALQGGLPPGYTITDNSIAVDNTTSCTLTGPGTTVGTFTATGIS